jgi:hypothetical protein
MSRYGRLASAVTSYLHSTRLPYDTRILVPEGIGHCTIPDEVGNVPTSLVLVYIHPYYTPVVFISDFSTSLSISFAISAAASST